VSILIAYQRGCDVIITIDDDNYFVPGQDFIGDHCNHVGLTQEIEELSSSSGWLNICDFLEEKRGYEFYARGYPMPHRWLEYPPVIKSARKPKRVMVNAGLWLDDPDVDAITRLCNSISATRYTKTESFAMGKGTWSPFNSQNTAIHRDVIEAYPLSPVVGRYDDIWISYVVLAIADHLGDACAFGFPLVKQDRNPHNFFVDHDNEKHGLEFTDRFCQWLRAIKLTGKTYGECLPEITAGISAALASEEKMKDDKRAFVAGFVKTLEVWHVTMAKVKANVVSK
jgi:hypothetical protein